MAHTRTQSAPFYNSGNPFDDSNFQPFDPLRDAPAEDEWVQFDRPIRATGTEGGTAVGVGVAPGMMAGGVVRQQSDQHHQHQLAKAPPQPQQTASSSSSSVRQQSYRSSNPRRSSIPSPKPQRAVTMSSPRNHKKKGHRRAKTWTSSEDLRAIISPRSSTATVETPPRSKKSSRHRSGKESEKQPRERTKPRKKQHEDTLKIPALSSPQKSSKSRHRRTKSHGLPSSIVDDSHHHHSSHSIDSPSSRKSKSSSSSSSSHRTSEHSQRRKDKKSTATPTRSKRGHRRVQTAPAFPATFDIKPEDYSPPAGQHFWAPLSIPSAKPTTGMSGPPDETPGLNVVHSDSSGEDDDYSFNEELDSWTNEPSPYGKLRKSRRKSKMHQPTINGVSAHSTTSVENQFKNLQFGIKVVDTDKWIFPPDKILFVQRGYYKGEYLDHIDFIFESMLTHNAVVVAIKIFKHGPNAFMSPAGDILNYKKHKYHKWVLNPGERVHCMTAERDDGRSGGALQSNKMGFSYLIGYKWKNKWHWG